jgi:hypothetical protein
MSADRPVSAETGVPSEAETRVFPMARPVPVGLMLGTVLAPLPLLVFALLVALTLAGGGVTMQSMLALLACAGIAAVAGWLLLRVYSRRAGPGEIVFEVGTEGLRVRSPIYGRAFPRSALRLGEARVVSLKTDPGLQPGYSLGYPLGMYLPGCCIGSYRLGDGTKALLYLNYPPGGEPFVFLPTIAGPPLLLSPDDPDAFLAALRTA